MEDPFKIGFKAFFGVAAGIGILVLIFNFIQSIDSAIENYKDNQERKEREIEKQYLLKLERERKLRKEKELIKYGNDALKEFR